MKRSLIIWNSLPLLLLLMMLGIFILNGDRLYYSFLLNGGRVVLQKGMWKEDQLATERQSFLRAASVIFSLASHHPQTPTSPETPHNMIPSILKAEYFRRSGDLYTASVWLHRAAYAEAYPPVQNSLSLLPTARLELDGSLVIDNTSPDWRVRRDTLVNAHVQQDRDSTILSWMSESEKDLRGSFAWGYRLHIPYHHEVSLDIRSQKGCSVIFETVIDGKLTRHVIHSGSDAWETLTFPVDGNWLSYLYVHLVKDVVEVTGCEVRIRKVSFLLTQ